jgi:hypothetical protein
MKWNGPDQESCQSTMRAESNPQEARCNAEITGAGGIGDGSLCLLQYGKLIVCLAPLVLISCR